MTKKAFEVRRFSSLFAVPRSLFPPTMNAITINLESIMQMTDEQFAQLCSQNRDLRLEKNAKGELIIMPPTGGGTGKRNFEINLQLGKWSEKNQEGVCFDSSTGFKLPNGANRSPDVAWIPLKKWNSLTPKQQSDQDSQDFRISRITNPKSKI